MGALISHPWTMDILLACVHVTASFQDWPEALAQLQQMRAAEQLQADGSHAGPCESNNGAGGSAIDDLLPMPADQVSTVTSAFVCMRDLSALGGHAPALFKWAIDSEDAAAAAGGASSKHLSPAHFGILRAFNRPDFLSNLRLLVRATQGLLSK